MYSKLLKIGLMLGLIGWCSVCLYAQERKIAETLTNDFVSSKGESENSGVRSLAPTYYRDAFVRYFDRIEEYRPQREDTAAFRYFHAVFGADTLDFKERRKELIRTKDKNRYLEVESERAPYQRFGAVVDGLTAAELEALKARMRGMKTNDRLMNNVQTCIFYALNLLLDAEGVDPAPVITRNTTFTNGHQLNAFFDRLFAVRGAYPCRYKMLRQADLPDRCVLVFRNARQEFIHAVFYRKETGEFYSKNGLFPPVVLRDIRPIIARYGRYDTRERELSKEGLDRLADTVVVYTLR